MLENKKMKFMLVGYFILMAVIYGGFSWLTKSQIDKSAVWMAKSDLTQIDIANIMQLSQWLQTLEVMFIVVFGVTVFLVIFWSKKDKSIVKPFININLILLALILGSSFIFSFIADMPVGNLLQILVIPAYLIGAIIVYTLLHAAGKLVKRTSL